MMNKILVVLLISGLSIGCGNTKSNSEKSMAMEKSQDNTEQTTATIQDGMLLGKFKKEDLEQEPFSNWFDSRYENYEAKPEALETIKNNISDYDITLFMGTWCGDSKRETPKILKLLDETGYDYDKLTMIGVDYSKNSPNGLAKKNEVIRVPTIIFSKNGKEVNRYVERPRESFEEDIAKIVSGKDYKNSYAN